mgnify:CR=1 FL=1
MVNVLYSKVPLKRPIDNETAWSPIKTSCLLVPISRVIVFGAHYIGGLANSNYCLTLLKLVLLVQLHCCSLTPLTHSCSLTPLTNCCSLTPLTKCIQRLHQEIYDHKLNDIVTTIHYYFVC